MKIMSGISRGIIVVLVGLILPGAARSADLAVNPVEVEYRQLERDIPSLYLINGLFLSADQAKNMAALQADAKRITDVIRLDLDRFFLNHQKELDQWLEASLRSGKETGKGPGGASRDWAQLQKVRKELMELLNANATNLNSLAGKALVVLSPGQSNILHRFVPCFIPPQDFRSPERVAQADGDTSPGEKVLTKTKAPAANAREVRAMVIRYLLNPGVQGVLLRRSGAAASRDSSSIITVELQAAALQARGKPFQAVGLANELCLTPLQAAQLLPIVQAMASQRKIIDERAHRSMQNALPAFQALLNELADQQPTSQTEATASRYHSQVKRLFEEDYLKELLVAEGQVDLLLSAGQVETLMAEQHGNSRKFGMQSPGAQRIKKNRQQATAVFDTMDKTDPIEWRKIKHEVCRSFVESCIRDQDDDSPAVDVAAQTARAEQVLDRARAMVQADYLQAKDELVAELCPRRNQPRPALYGWKQAQGDPLESLNPTTYLLFSPAMQSVLERIASRKLGI